MPEHTGGMVALLPDRASAERLALPDYRGGLPLDELHLTLAHVGDDVTGWTAHTRRAVLAAAQTAVGKVGWEPLDGRAFAHATFNPDSGPDGDRDPCAVYLVGDTRRLVPLRDAVLAALRCRCTSASSAPDCRRFPGRPRGRRLS